MSYPPPLRSLRIDSGSTSAETLVASLSRNTPIRSAVDFAPRIAPRFDLRAPVEYRGEGFSGHGTVWNISASGALVEHAQPRPVAGARLGLSVSYFPGSREIELWSEVVRVTPTGFAVAFDSLEETAQRLLQRLLPSAR